MGSNAYGAANAFLVFGPQQRADANAKTFVIFKCISNRISIFPNSHHNTHTRTRTPENLHLNAHCTRWTMKCVCARTSGTLPCVHAVIHNLHGCCIHEVFAIHVCGVLQLKCLPPLDGPDKPMRNTAPVTPGGTTNEPKHPIYISAIARPRHTPINSIQLLCTCGVRICFLTPFIRVHVHTPFFALAKFEYTGCVSPG